MRVAAQVVDQGGLSGAARRCCSHGRRRRGVHGLEAQYAILDDRARPFYELREAG